MSTQLLGYASVVTIAGSPSHPSRSAAILEYATARLRSAGQTVESIIVRDLDPTELIHGQSNGATILPALESIASASKIIIATPVYKASFTGVLKTFLDLIPPQGFAGKTILPLVCGAALTHYLALDFALKPVLAELGASTILPGLYILDKQIDYKPSFAFTDPTLKERLDALIDRLALAD